jgi:hypothetical protein
MKIAQGLLKNKTHQVRERRANTTLQLNLLKRESFQKIV